MVRFGWRLPVECDANLEPGQHITHEPVQRTNLLQPALTPTVDRSRLLREKPTNQWGLGSRRFRVPPYVL